MLCEYTAPNIIDSAATLTQRENRYEILKDSACVSAPHLQVPDQTRPPLSGTQSGQQQEVQRRALREPQVRHAGQHPSVRDKKKKGQIYCQNTARERRNNNTLMREKQKSRN